MIGNSFPTDWSMQKLSACCEIVSGATPKRNVEKYWDGDIPWVTPKDLSKLATPVLDCPPEFITKEGLKSCSSRLLPKGSILFSSRAPIGLTAIAGREMCTNQGFKSLIPGDEVDSGYLFHCMKWMAPKIAEMGNGATFKEVSKEVVGRVEIPLPPLPEQRRIAAILDKADAIRRKRQQAIRLTEDFLRSVFLDMFGDPVTNPKGWDVGTIRDLVSEVKYGSSGKAGPEGQYPMLRMNNLTYEGGWNFSSLKYIDLPEKDLGKYLVQKGDLLFNRTNSKELVGKTAVFDQEEPMAYAGYLIRVRPNEGNTNEYISGYLNSEHGKQTLVGMCKSIVGMANINAQELQNIKILKAPPEEQKKYQAIVKSVQCFRKSLDEPVELTANLFNSLAQRAFRGEL